MAVRWIDLGVRKRIVKATSTNEVTEFEFGGRYRNQIHPRTSYTGSLVPVDFQKHL